MRSVNFFQALGLFVAEDFLSADFCSSLRSEMDVSASEKATVTKDGQEGFLDEDSRNVLSIGVSEGRRRSVRERLRAIKPGLEAHFSVSLSRKCHGPDFLSYLPGGFYRPHRDGSEGAPEKIRARRVSVVIFLNAQSQEPAPDSFGGGGLTFYGLMGGPDWSKCAFTLDPALGMLVAFRSDTLHEAQPVTFGKRYAVVTWFTQGEDRPEATAAESESDASKQPS
ncbi:MAG: 2OG-Fe(II) oxygenase [Candidatus Binataceae bacterium]